MAAFSFTPLSHHLYIFITQCGILPLRYLTQLMRHGSLDTKTIYMQATKKDLQQDVEKIV